MRKPSIASITTICTDLASQPRMRVAGLTLFYVAVLASLVALYGRGDFSTPSFIYQDF
jgi:hypothetical protein